MLSDDERARVTLKFAELLRAYQRSLPDANARHDAEHSRNSWLRLALETEEIHKS
jgi:hypothetical protein